MRNKDPKLPKDFEESMPFQVYTFLKTEIIWNNIPDVYLFILEQDNF